MLSKIFRPLLALALLCAFTFHSFAQTEINTEFNGRMNYVFGPLEKARVPYGLLLDYAMEFTNLSAYNGTLSDTNKVGKGALRDIYATLATSQVYAPSGYLPSPDYIDSFWQIQRVAGTITLGGVYFNYARFRDDAASNGLVTISNDQIFDRYVNGVWQNPYQTETVFAMSPPLKDYHGRSFQVMLPSNVWLTNNSQAISSIAADFGDGVGYRILSFNQALTLTYADTGTKAWTFRLTLSSGGTLYSHSQVRVLPEPNSSSGGSAIARYPMLGTPPFLTADEAYNGIRGSGWITIDYANVDRKLRRPLIVVEGFDPGWLLEPEKQYGKMTLSGFKEQIRDPLFSGQLASILQGDNQQYDIVYVDWYRGTDYIQRNALLLEKVIRRVNEEKALAGSTESNVVIGFSMGGVVARWALRDMELRSNVTGRHDTRLFVSWDSPQQGAHLPASYQHLARQVRNIALRYGFGGALFSFVAKGTSLLDEPAARQMLMNRFLDNGNLDNLLHDNWQAELRTMGYPVGDGQRPFRKIAVSNGSECGIDQPFIAPGATLLSINGKVNTNFLGDVLGMIGLPIYGWLTGQPAFLLGLIPGRNDFFVDFYCGAQPDGAASQIYRGKLEYRKKALWLINITTTISNRTRNANPSILPIDGTAGGYYDLGYINSVPVQTFATSGGISIQNTPWFNFIPTASALGIGSDNITLTLAHYKRPYVGGAPPTPPIQSAFNNFTTAFPPTENANNNEGHIAINPRNGNFVAEELNGNTNVRTNCAGSCTNNRIEGPETICPSGTFSISQSPGSTVVWDAAPASAVQLNPNGNSVQVTLQGNGNNAVTLIATLYNECAGTVTFRRQITVGSPNQYTRYASFTSGGVQDYLADYNCLLDYTFPGMYSGKIDVEDRVATAYSWTLMEKYPSTAHIVSGPAVNPQHFTLTLKPLGAWVRYRLNTSNACGSYTYDYVFKTDGPCNIVAIAPPDEPSSSLTIAPNPVKNTFVATIMADRKDAFIRELAVIGRNGLEQKRVKFVQGSRSQTIDIGDLPVDVYVVKVFDGEKWLSARIIKQ